MKTRFVPFLLCALLWGCGSLAIEDLTERYAGLAFAEFERDWGPPDDTHEGSGSLNYLYFRELIDRDGRRWRVFSVLVGADGKIITVYPVESTGAASRGTER